MMLSAGDDAGTLRWSDHVLSLSVPMDRSDAPGDDDQNPSTAGVAAGAGRCRALCAHRCMPLVVATSDAGVVDVFEVLADR